MKINDELLRIMERISNTTATEEEIIKFNSWCDSFKGTETEIPNLQDIQARVLRKVHKNITKKPRFFTLYINRIVVAAAAVIAIVFGVWFYNSNPSSQHDEFISGSQLANDIGPGKNKAILTLATGKSITLSEAKSGILIEGTKLTYNDGTAIDLPGDSELNPGQNQVQTITTPYGGTYQIILPDGTKVWLNAATTLKFQSNFLDKDMRYVELDGEAYFQVSKLKAVAGNDVPFQVKSDGQVVKVLGTHFNINAYKSEENILTTLFEGAVSVATTSSKQSKLLVPGQQSLVSGQTLTVQQAHLEEAIAWKEGRFQYDQLDIQGLMRQVERWYDVEVIYEGKIPDKKYVVNISRNLPLHKFLNILSFTGLKFKIDGRKIIVKS